MDRGKGLTTAVARFDALFNHFTSKPNDSYRRKQLRNVTLYANDALSSLISYGKFIATDFDELTDKCIGYFDIGFDKVPMTISLFESSVRLRVNGLHFNEFRMKDGKPTHQSILDFTHATGITLTDIMQNRFDGSCDFNEYIDDLKNGINVNDYLTVPVLRNHIIKWDIDKAHDTLSTLPYDDDLKEDIHNRIDLFSTRRESIGHWEAIDEIFKG